MTLRAIIIGLIAAVVMAAGGHYCEAYLNVPGLVRGHLPLSVFGLLIFFAVVVNPLLGKLRSSWRQRPREIALILALLLVGCSITSAGLLRVFPSTLVYPILRAQVQPDWQRTKILEYTPPALLANRGVYSEEVVGNFVTPMGDEGNPISITDVPWHAWGEPLLVWGGIIILTTLAVISLSVLVHRQWARRERLRYPLAALATSLLECDQNGRTKILQNKLFWLGLVIPLTIQLVNGLYAWFPNSIQIPLSFDFSVLNERFPKFMSTPLAGYFAGPRLYPACVGLTFLLASDIGFSLGITNGLGVIAMYVMISMGMDISGNYLTGGYREWQTFGSFLAMALMLVYIGRRYYWVTLKQAVTFIPEAETERSSVLALQALILSMAALIGVLVAVGLEWPLAVLGVFLIMLMFLVMARLNAECGTFFYKPTWLMPGILVGLFGFTTLGPKAIVILGLLMFLLSGDPFECLMPFAVNGLKVTADTGHRSGRGGLMLAIAFVLAFVIAAPLTLWADYNEAAFTLGGGYSCSIYDIGTTAVTQLNLSGELEKVNQYTSWERLMNIRPDSRFFLAVAIGFLLVIGCSAMRLRYLWWPLHPVVFLGFASWTLGKYGASFFLGWLLKAAVTKLGGPGQYVRVRPMMLGVVVGDLAGGCIMMLTFWLYYAITGTAGPPWGFW